MGTFLPGILVFGLVVFIHELGHFLVARACGVPVDRFSIGFGPKLFGFQRGRTEYVVSALPLGGYVKMAGEEMPEPGATPDPDTLFGHPWWHRVLIALAGPGANFVFAIVVTILMFMTGIHTPDGHNVVGAVEPASAVEQVGLQPGDVIVEVDGQPTASSLQVRIAMLGGEKAPRLETPADVSLVVERNGERVPVAVPAAELKGVAEKLTFHQQAVVGEVLNGMPAYVAGVQVGDRIVAIDGAPVRGWSDLISLIAQRGGEKIQLTIERASGTVNLAVTPMKQEEKDGTTVGRIGIVPEFREYVRKYPVGEAITNGTMETLARVGLTAEGIFSLFRNPLSIGQAVSGPIAIMEMSGQAAQKGLFHLMNMTALISIALMVFNLLPIPILDGGMVVMSIIEGIRRRPVPIAVQAISQRVGFVLLGSLIVFALLNDPLKMIRRNRAISESKGRTTQGDVREAPNDSAR
jgi:regulator of sigma E protease